MLLVRQITGDISLTKNQLIRDRRLENGKGRHGHYFQREILKVKIKGLICEWTADGKGTEGGDVPSIIITITEHSRRDLSASNRIL